MQPQEDKRLSKCRLTMNRFPTYIQISLWFVELLIEAPGTDIALYQAILALAVFRAIFLLLIPVDPPATDRIIFSGDHAWLVFLHAGVCWYLQRDLNVLDVPYHISKYQRIPSICVVTGSWMAMQGKEYWRSWHEWLQWPKQVLTYCWEQLQARRQLLRQQANLSSDSSLDEQDVDVLSVNEEGK